MSHEGLALLIGVMTAVAGAHFTLLVVALREVRDIGVRLTRVEVHLGLDDGRPQKEA